MLKNLLLGFLLGAIGVVLAYLVNYYPHNAWGFLILVHIVVWIRYVLAEFSSSGDNRHAVFRLVGTVLAIILAVNFW